MAENIFLLRDGLVRLLEAHGHTVIASVETGPAALDAMLGLRPDVAVLDVAYRPPSPTRGCVPLLPPARRFQACRC